MSLLGDKMAYSRQKVQYSKKEMADMLDISPSTLSRYEKGTTMPSVITLYMLSIITDTIMEDFVNETLSLEEFKVRSQKTTLEMFLELHDWIMKGTF